MKHNGAGFKAHGTRFKRRLFLALCLTPCTYAPSRFSLSIVSPVSLDFPPRRKMLYALDKQGHMSKTLHIHESLICQLQFGYDRQGQK